MGKLNEYTPDNPPKRGKPKKIWDALHRAGFQISGLRYNPNCWGRGKELGWGTWAFDEIGNYQHGYFCGVEDDRVYVQLIVAPYTRYWADSIKS